MIGWAVDQPESANLQSTEWCFSHEKTQAGTKEDEHLDAMPSVFARLSELIYLRFFI
jgi:hypothetical protein